MVRKGAIKKKQDRESLPKAAQGQTLKADDLRKNILVKL